MNSFSIHALQVPRVQLFTLLILEMLAHGTKILVWVGARAWFPSLSCCEIWDDPNRNKTACSSSEPLGISLKKYGKDFPFDLHVLPRAIMFYHMNRYKLSWVILSFAEWWVRSRKVLVIYRSFSFAYPLFASLKCLACQLPTPGIDIHLCQTIPLTTKPKFSTVSLSISNGLSKKCSLPITLSSWSMSHLPLKQKLKKNWTKKHWKKEKEKGDKTHTSTQES